MTRETVVVTAAGGFVCSQIAEALAMAGYEVVGVDQTFDAATRSRLSHLRLIEGTLPQAVDALRGIRPAVVIHGAAITATPSEMGLSRAAHLRRNIDMVTGMLDWAQGAGAERFLFLSSMGVFDPADGPRAQDRFTEATRPTATCAYCVAKQAGEALTAAAAEPGFATLSLRLGNIFGPHEAARLTRPHMCLASRMQKAARETGMIALETPSALREWAWLPDLAAGVVALIAGFPTKATRVLHAGSPPTMTDLDLACAIAERIGGTRVRIVPPPHMAIRPPMASAHSNPFDQTSWTPIHSALDRLIPAEATP